MANCDNCEATIFYGGRKEGIYRYCCDKCYQKGYVESGFAAVPPDLFESELRKLHQGPCPDCGGAGPVDVHFAHKVWSAIYLSSRTSQPFVCCCRCGRKKQMMGALFSFFAGWWSIHGLVLTPFQILANIAGMLRPPNRQKPSLQLQKTVRALLARQVDASVPSSPPIRAANAAQKTARPAPDNPFSDIGKPLR